MFYTYFCNKCNYEKEVRHSIDKTPKVICPIDKEKMKKKITGGGGIIFKGIGWSSKGTATAPKPRHYREVGVSIPKYFKDVVKK